MTHPGQAPEPAGATGRSSKAGRTSRRGPLVPVAITVLVVLALGATGAVLAYNRAVATAEDSHLASESARVKSVAASMDSTLTTEVEQFSASGPVALVRTYLTALSKGDAEAALAVPGASADGLDTRLMTDKVYGALKEHLTSPQITQAVYQDLTATVSATYRLGKETVQADYVLHREQKDSAYTEWQMDSAYTQELEVSLTREGKVAIGGADVSNLLEGKKGSQSLKIPALPGVYPVDYTDPDKFYAAPTADVAAGSQEIASAIKIDPTVSKSVTEKARKKAQKQSDTWMDQCASSELTGNTCSKAVKKEGTYIKDKAVLNVGVDEYAKIELTWNESKGYWTYSAKDFSTRGMFKTTGTLVGGGTGTRVVAQEFHGTVKWKSDGSIDMTRVFDN